MDTTPRESANSSSRGSRRQESTSATRSIVKNSPIDVHQVKMMGDFDDETVDLICQIAQVRRTCNLCQSGDHLIIACPRLKDLRHDPTKVRRMIRTIGSLIGINPESFSAVLDPTKTRSSRNATGTRDRNATPPRSNTLPTRQLLDDDDTDGESVINQVESDARSLNDTDDKQSPDF